MRIRIAGFAERELTWRCHVIFPAAHVDFSLFFCAGDWGRKAEGVDVAGGSGFYSILCYNKNKARGPGLCIWLWNSIRTTTGQRVISKLDPYIDKLKVNLPTHKLLTKFK